ncbi:MAG: VanZ family protein [Candidatus Aminicenantes bacterium]|nr:VanZ family protein [Candidatus Aminicenantes bacterium]
MKRWLYFLPAVLFYLSIFALSSRGIRFGFHLGHLDKIGHFLEFGSLGFLLAIGFFNAFSFSPSMKTALTFGTGLILAILDEWHQFFVPMRKSDVLDIVADAAGLAFGIFIFRSLAGWRKKALHK